MLPGISVHLAPGERLHRCDHCEKVFRCEGCTHPIMAITGGGRGGRSAWVFCTIRCRTACTKVPESTQITWWSTQDFDGKELISAEIERDNYDPSVLYLMDSSSSIENSVRKNR